MSAPGARILDFGCGEGAVVEAGLQAGFDVVGSEIFYAGAPARAEVQRKGLLDRHVFEMEDGRLPFEDSRFDLVTSNQVFEHVVDLEPALREVHRVLKGGGLLLALFPSSEAIREGHIGIPFVHWIRRGSRLRLGYASLLRRLGLGYHDEPVRPRDWAEHWLNWLDLYTIYRPRREIVSTFGRYFDLDFIEEDYAAFRLSSKGRLRPLARLVAMPGVAGPSRVLLRRLGTMVVLARKRPAGTGDGGGKPA